MICSLWGTCADQSVCAQEQPATQHNIFRQEETPRRVVRHVRQNEKSTTTTQDNNVTIYQSGPELKLDRPAKEFLRNWSETYLKAKSLSFVSHVTFASNSSARTRSMTIRFWAQRPNLLRAEVETGNPKDTGVMVSDGKAIWEYLSGMNEYMRTDMIEPLYIRGELGLLSEVPPCLMFHPEPASVLRYGLKSLEIKGTEKIGKENCLVVVRQLPKRVIISWCSDRDYMPRLIVSYNVSGSRLVETYREVRTEVKVDSSLPRSLFTLSIPKTARQRFSVHPEDVLLKSGAMAPDFTARDRDGKTVRFSSLRGKNVLLTFWAGWCPSCLDGLSSLNRLQAEFADKNVVVVAVNTWDYPTALQDYLGRHPRSRLLLWADPGSEAKSEREETFPYKLYGVRGLPTTFLIGADGKIAQSWIGYDEKKPDEFRDALNDLLKP